MNKDPVSEPCPHCGARAEFYARYDRICCESCGRASLPKPNAFAEEFEI